MVDEKEGHYEEEGEYHFSDDQTNYDVEPESSKATSTSTSAFSKETFLEKLKQHRKKILGLVSLIISIGIVYKILIPASTAPATEFNQTMAAKTVKPATMTKVKSTTVTQSVTAPVSSPAIVQPPSAAVENKPISSPAPVQQNQPPVAAVAPAPIAANPPVNPVQQPLMNEVSSPNTPVNVSAQSVPLPSTLAETAVPSMDTQVKDRITALEQQNTAMMNLLQTEYAQKIADTETQANAVRGKMEELTKRVNRMETSLNQLIQLLQGASKSQASTMMGSAQAFTPNAATRSAEPRMIYSVQAIIPGRAWLKSESGDTVTVAEGDYLKKYGRVTKIDPYDGIVSIDTGNKIITLSYGLDGE